MKCPKCGFFVSDRLDSCKKCGQDLTSEKAKLGLGFLATGISRFFRKNGIPAPAAFAGAAPPQKAAATPPPLEENPKEIESAAVGAFEDEDVAVVVSSDPEESLENLETRQDSFDFDFSEPASFTIPSLEDDADAEAQGLPSCADSAGQPGADEVKIPCFPAHASTIQAEPAQAEAGESPGDEFDFPDLKGVEPPSAPVQSVGFAADGVPPSSAGAVSGPRDLGQGEEVSSPGQQLPDTEALDEEELALLGAEDEGYPPGEREGTGTVMLDPDEIEAILRAELSPPQQATTLDTAKNKAGHKSDIDDEELSRLLEDLDIQNP